MSAERARHVATVLGGGWRRAPPSLSLSLAEAAPLRLATGVGRALAGR